jgi:hypothetical protein
MSVKKDCSPPLTTDGSQVECKAVFQNLTTCDEGSGSQPAAVINGTVTNQIQNSPASTTTAPVCYAALACSDPGQPGSCTPDLVGGALPQPYGLAAGDGNAGGPDTIVCLMTEQINVSDKGYCDDGNVDTPNEQACDPAAPSCGAGETCVAIECVANAGIKVQDRAVFRGVAQPDPTTDVSGSPEANVQVKCCGDQFVNVVGEYCDTDPHGTIPGPAGELAQECPNPNPLVPVGDEGNNDFGCLANIDQACRAPGTDGECTLCGDGVRQDVPFEQCDRDDFKTGAPAGSGDCRADCTFCGDGITQAIEECDPANPNDPITQAGQCQADCTRKLECKVTLDKQVSGNGVGNYKDVGDFPPGRIVGMATGWTDEDASHQFVVKNDTDPALGAKLKCVLTDYRGSAAATGPVIHEFPPFDLDPGKSTTLKWTGTCNEGEKETDLEGPDVAKVKCDCVDPIDGSDTGDDVSDEDEAKLVCQTPGPNVTKLCEEEPGGTFKFIITGSNPGSVCDGTNDGCEVAGDCEGVACVAVDAATLINCKAVDTTYPGTCPATFCPDGTPCTMDSQCAPEKCLEGTPIYGPETIPFVPSTLKPGDTAQADKTGVTLSETSCNKVTMECEVLDVDAPGGGCVPDPTGGCKKFTAEAEDDCPVSDLICRTPGFWGTHGGIEKGSKSKNITQAVIDSIGTDGCIEVCGENINNTKVGSDASALEAMCVSPRGDQRLQLVRQLTAMALNCIVSGIGADCAGDGALDTLFSECSETVCRDDKEGATYKSVGQCIGTIDCFNNGGIVGGGACKPTPDGEPSCHTEPLPEEFLLNGRPGAAGSSGACKDAREAGSCTVIKSDSTSGTEANCTKPIDAEVCAP